MPNKELIKILKERQGELLKELDAINTMLTSKSDKEIVDTYLKVFDGLLEKEQHRKEIEEYFDNVFKHTDKNYIDTRDTGTSWVKSNANNYIFWFKHHGENKLPKKEDRTWKNYLIDVILELGGQARTSDIANFIILNNKELTFSKARQIAADLLPELVEKGLLNVEKGDSKKEGHLYKIGEIGLKPVPVGSISWK
jgi:predicted glycosyltransferase